MGLLRGISIVVEQLLDFQSGTVEVGSVKKNVRLWTSCRNRRFNRNWLFTRNGSYKNLVLVTLHYTPVKQFTFARWQNSLFRDFNWNPFRTNRIISYRMLKIKKSGRRLIFTCASCWCIAQLAKINDCIWQIKLIKKMTLKMLFGWRYAHITKFNSVFEQEYIKNNTKTLKLIF